jgi:hypothetical protein
MPPRQTPLFVHSRTRSRSLGARSIFGEWLLNPDLLRIPVLADPNSGRGLDLGQLKALSVELSKLHKRLSREIVKRGRKPQALVGRCAELFLKHYRPELDIKAVWAKVRVGLRKEGFADADWEKLRDSAKRRMKREGTYPARKP